MTKVSERPDEISLIEHYFAPLAGEGAFGLRDDAACLDPAPGKSWVMTQDAIAEGVHFGADDPPELIAKKALRVNLSDLAAKGAKPRYFSLALGLADTWDEPWIAEFARGLAADCATFNIALTGGDTFRSGGGFVISITAIGEVPRGEYVSRLGASPGDTLFVTGTIGDAYAGLLARQDRLADIGRQNRAFVEDRYLLPQPRCEFADIIRQYASASIDVSDGLVGDLAKLRRASDVSATVSIDAVPLSSAVKMLVGSDPGFLQRAVTGGDDYELLFAVGPDKMLDLERQIEKQNLPVTRIGNFGEAGKGAVFLDTTGNPITFERTGYQHFGDPG